MSNSEDLYCNRVIRTLTAVARATMALHGRDLYNMFGLYGAELKRDIHDLVERRYMGTGFDPAAPPGAVILPAMAFKNARRMRYMWDYFVFICMSHKIQNIKRRQLASGSVGVPIVLYLRGSDYQLAISRKGAAVGHTTMDDTWFNFTFLGALKNRYLVLKALSPSDVQTAMGQIGLAFARHGNELQSVAEFARDYDGGVFLNPANWRERVVELFPSASLFLVYVSNQSNGLAYELECLAARGLEANAILVLDKDRFGSRDTFFMLQERLKEIGEELYLSVDRDACAVDDPDAFERLLSRFPHRVELGDDRDAVLREIEALIPTARREDAVLPTEFPFEFRIALDGAEEAEVAALRDRVAAFVEAGLSAETVANWPALVLHIEMDILLSLAFGDIEQAATSTARYAGIAKVVRAILNASSSERAAAFDGALEQCETMAMSVAYDAFALGPWNDYADRRAVSRERVDAAVGAVIDLMGRSVERAGAIHMQEPRPETPPPAPSDYSDLMESLLASLTAAKAGSGDG